MKKALFYIGIIAMSVMSCNKWAGDNAEQIEVPEGKYLFTLRATTDWGTKTSYTDESSFQWSNGDEISVLFHNTAVGHEDENEFYTLSTTTGGASSASFSGLIDEGWEIGASDTKTKWALYPAGAHSYTVGSAYPTFNIPTVTDFTASHDSANMPMVTDGDGGYTFKHLTNAFKFTFIGIDVSKVKLVVENLASLNLSGDAPIAKSDAYYLEYGSNTSKTITLIKNVSSKTAEFYVPYRIYNASFQPRLTLYDASNNYTIKTVTANTDFSTVSVGDRQFKDKRIIVVPSISAPGTGTAPFVPLIDIDGDMSDWDDIDMYPLDAVNDAFSGDGNRLKEWKVASDSRFIYFYFKSTMADGEKFAKKGTGGYFVTTFDTVDAAGSSDGYTGLSGADYRAMTYPFSSAPDADVSFYTPSTPSGSSNIKATPFDGSSLGTAKSAGTKDATYAYVELSILRSTIGSPASGRTITVKVSANYTPSSQQSITLE